MRYRIQRLMLPYHLSLFHRFLTSSTKGRVTFRHLSCKNNFDISHRGHDAWPLSPKVRTMCPVLRKRNMRNVDKEKHVTRVSADVALTYERDGNHDDVMSGYVRVTCVFLVDVTHVTFTYVAAYCSEFGTRFDSIMSSL